MRYGYGPFVNLAAYVRSAGIGAVAGLRTFTAPAATLESGGNIWAGIVVALAAGELIADKLPFTPSRLAPGGLIARIVSGGLCGGELAVRGAASRVLGTLTGAAAAVGSAWIGASVRTSVARLGKVPDLPVALVEDGIAIVAARAAVADPPR